MNRVILMGRLTRDPDMRYTQGENGMAIARFTLAVDRRRVNQDGIRDADFISCVAFGRLAEFAEKYLHQGIKIVLAGRIQTGSYTRKDGDKEQRVYTTDVVAEDLEFAESKSAEDYRRSRDAGNDGRNSYSGSSGLNSGREKATVSKVSSENVHGEESDIGEGFMNIPEGVEDDGLPFN